MHHDVNNIQVGSASIDLIMRRVLLRIILLQEAAIDRHHESIVVRSYEAVCSI